MVTVSPENPQHATFSVGTAARARLRTKVVGSIAEETIYRFCRMHIYLWLNDGNLQPLFTMQNLSAAKWQPLPNGHFRNRQFEAGEYTRFDSDEILDSWQNPVTDAIYQRPMAERDRQPHLFLGLALLLRGASR